MSESGDYTPAAHWKGYDFASAKRSYADKVISRGSVDPVTIGLDKKSLVPASLVSDAEANLVIACDVTGSMGKWPGTIFSKLPYLEFETKEYLGDSIGISFAAIGDGHHDQYPLQVRPFVNGIELKTSLEKLIIEGGGGGSSEESYDLAAAYYAYNVSFPKSIHKPIFIFIGDEGLYNYLDENMLLEWSKHEMTQKMAVKELFDKLKAKYSVYIIRKPYNCEANNPTPSENRIQNQWIDLLGAENVVSLPNADRVVDVIFGILAKETNRLKYFKEELTERQMKDKDGKLKIDVVMKSLKTIMPNSVKKLPPPSRAVSVTKKKSSSKSVKSISLLDE